MERELKIRAIKPEDIEHLKVIWNEYFREEFTFPDFINGYYCAFLVESNSSIIAAAGVRPIAEVVLITNKKENTRNKREALVKIMQASMFTASRFGHDSLHAFIQDEGWQQHLINRANFKPTKGRSIFLEL